MHEMSRIARGLLFLAAGTAFLALFVFPATRWIALNQLQFDIHRSNGLQPDALFSIPAITPFPTGVYDPQKNGPFY